MSYCFVTMEEESGTAGESSQAPKIDTVVGTIVWVRRRNGSWWPGRILGADELSETHLLSPRSGTPVKLLGREDASVDWYNIEKSKRVKAFRCGEYDDCIERAKAYANLPAKKVVKYARREDAILHALELEKKQLMQKQQSTCLEVPCSDEKKHGSKAKQSQVCVPGSPKDKSEQKPGDYSVIVDHDSPLDASHSAVSFQQTDSISAPGPVDIQKVKRVNEADVEDDGIQGTTRMRGLQDFGLKIVPKKKQPYLPATCEGIPKAILPENVVRSPSYIGRSIGYGSPVNSSKGSSLTLKKKKSEVGPVQESFAKRRDRRRPLTKVLESSAKLPVPSFSDYNYSVVESVRKRNMESEIGILQSKPVKSSLSTLPRNSSEYTGTSLEKDISMQTYPHVYEAINGGIHSVSLVTENACSNLSEHMDVNYCDKSYLHPDYPMEENGLTDVTLLSSSTSRRFRSGMVGRQPSRPIEGQLSVTSKEGLDETGFSSYLCQSDSVEQNMHGIPDQRVSKWQSKGKRNARPLNKKHCESSNWGSAVETGDTCTAPMYGIPYEDKFTLNKELGTKKVIGGSYGKFVSSVKQEEELNNYFFSEGLLQDGCRQRKKMFSDNQRHIRLGNPISKVKAEVDDLHFQAEIDQYIPEGTAGSFSNGNSQGMSPSEEMSTKIESSLSDEKIFKTKWLIQTDSQETGQQRMHMEGLDSGTSSGMIFETLKSVGETQFKVSDSARVSKLGINASDLSRSMLFDVHVEAKATYQGEHVPLVSLMSRLNGKAIVGHPVTVESLDYGYCDAYIADDSHLNETIADSLIYGDGGIGKSTVQPPWRTARRTEMQRVPRGCPSRKGYNVNHSLCQPSGSQNGLFAVKAGYAGINDKSRYIRKNSLHRRLPTLDKKSSKKLLKRIGLSSKKTRTLSSIDVEHELKYLNG
ncbi:hypothetical protein SUGI_0580170 [Cryptomeria japonica]|nr:hypothetical protein SUGI_0580170 [Cryptomeria japonica]